MSRPDLLHRPVELLLKAHPYARDFFSAIELDVEECEGSLDVLLSGVEAEHLERFGLTREALVEQFLEFLEHMETFRAGDQPRIERVTVEAGIDKSGRPEACDLELRAGEVVCVVGPTGSGKSQLLADIESLAQGDTPSGRRILLDGRAPDEALRLSGERQIVAQLSQNMNFVMDLSVREFVTMHAGSRLVGDVAARVERILSMAVDLAGEPFTPDTPITALSGGQSRALMIADVACLSASLIVLIDEIENAGVDRLRALELLVNQDKMVLMATHDPLLALSGSRRVVIRNGGIAAILETSEEERAGLEQLAVLDGQLARLRNQVRRGERVVFGAEWSGSREMPTPYGEE